MPTSTATAAATWCAATAKGKVYIHTSHGDGTFSPRLGPTANVRALRSLTSAGNLVGNAAPDLIGVKGNSLVVVANKGTIELGSPIDTGVSFADANLVINAGDWDRDGAGDVITRGSDGASCSTAATARASWPSRRRSAAGFGEVTGPHRRGRRDRRRLPRPPRHRCPAACWTVYAGTGSAPLRRPGRRGTQR